jgi:myotubularin-related protein 10/11/12
VISNFSPVQANSIWILIIFYLPQEQDNRFYTLLDKSCWLLYVSLCLKSATNAAEKLRNGETVVLQENEGRDMCCIISSLIQLLLDPYWRTIIGFQTLIQKEWVALGHPFR